MQTYCERCGPGLFDEPINAISNIAFLLAAWAVWRVGRRLGVLMTGLWLLIGLAVSVGIGSALWHTFATQWAMVLDVVPIMLFQFTFLWLYGRHAVELHWVVVGLILAVYAGVGFWLSGQSEWLNGGLTYAPTLALGFATGIHQYLSGRPQRFHLLAAAVVFTLALVCRSIDLIVCRQFPIGTHFLWHVLTGLVVYLSMRSVITIWADHRIVA